MPRIRTIKPEFWTDEKVGECSIPARLLFIATWNIADDRGNLERKPCNHGHGTERYVLSNACVHCDRSNAKRQYERRKARVKELKAMRQGV